MAFWKTVLNKTGARSVTEIGSNAGWNLSAIRRVHPDIQLYGYDVNQYATEQARSAALPVWLVDPDKQQEIMRAELVFTAGVLIHQDADAVKAMMQRIIDASYHWVLAVEYPADKEEHVKYRGMDGYLWRRPYGRMYRNMGLIEVDSWPVTMKDGFDNCTAWLLKKPT